MQEIRFLLRLLPLLRKIIVRTAVVVPVRLFRVARMAEQARQYTGSAETPRLRVFSAAVRFRRKGAGNSAVIRRFILSLFPDIGLSPVRPPCTPFEAGHPVIFRLGSAVFSCSTSGAISVGTLSRLIAVQTGSSYAEKAAFFFRRPLLRLISCCSSTAALCVRSCSVHRGEMPRRSGMRIHKPFEKGRIFIGDFPADRMSAGILYAGLLLFTPSVFTAVAVYKAHKRVKFIIL